jgi:H+/Cl- antiporter ClcA
MNTLPLDTAYHYDARPMDRRTERALIWCTVAVGGCIIAWAGWHTTRQVYSAVSFIYRNFANARFRSDLWDHLASHWHVYTLLAGAFVFCLLFLIRVLRGDLTRKDHHQ